MFPNHVRLACHSAALEHIQCCLDVMNLLSHQSSKREIELGMTWMEVPGVRESVLDTALQLLSLKKGKAMWSMCCNKYSWPIRKSCCAQTVIRGLGEVISQHKECVLWVIFRPRIKQTGVKESENDRAVYGHGKRSCSNSRQWKVHTKTVISQAAWGWDK